MLILALVIAVALPAIAWGNTVTIPAAGAITATASSGFVQSPGHPNLYPNRVNGVVTFNINGTAGKFLEISALAFNVEGSDDMCYDALNFQVTIDGKTLNYGPRCGPSPVYFNKMLIESTSVKLTFTSDGTGRRSGFKLSYRVVDRPEPTPVQNFTCGRPVVEPCLPLPTNNTACNRRIVNGDDALPKSWPWQIGMVQALSPNKVYCGGSLVHPCWIVTAAHCVRGDAATSVFIKLGTHLRSQRREVLPVSEIIIHPGYDITTMNYDIALLKLGKCVRFNDTVRPVCLSKPSDPSVVGEICVVTGWGLDEEVGGVQPIALQEAELTVVNKTVCQKSNPEFNVTDLMLCAGGYKKDTCQGDSGGPLVCRNPDKSYSLAGVTSFGYGCARVGRYGVYAYVKQFYDWISLYVSNV